MIKNVTPSQVLRDRGPGHHRAPLQPGVREPVPPPGGERGNHRRGREERRARGGSRIGIRGALQSQFCAGLELKQKTWINKEMKYGQHWNLYLDVNCLKWHFQYKEVVE